MALLRARDQRLRVRRPASSSPPAIGRGKDPAMRLVRFLSWRRGVPAALGQDPRSPVTRATICSGPGWPLLERLIVCTALGRDLHHRTSVQRFEQDTCYGDALPTELRGRVLSCLTWVFARPAVRSGHAQRSNRAPVDVRRAYRPPRAHRFGRVHLRVIRRRCQASRFPAQPVGCPQRGWHQLRQCRQDRAVGPVRPGPGHLAAETITSWRSTMISASLDAWPRPSRTS